MITGSKNYQNGGNMKYILLAVVLTLAACDKPAAPKIAAPQREALEKAKGVDQMVQDATDASKKQIEEAGK
jgi:hypothetical protein